MGGMQATCEDLVGGTCRAEESTLAPASEASKRLRTQKLGIHMPPTTASREGFIHRSRYSRSVGRTRCTNWNPFQPCQSKKTDTDQFTMTGNSCSCLRQPTRHQTTAFMVLREFL